MVDDELPSIPPPVISESFGVSSEELSFHDLTAPPKKKARHVKVAPGTLSLADTTSVRRSSRAAKPKVAGTQDYDCVAARPQFAKYVYYIEMCYVNMLTKSHQIPA